jgi:hypothetical protein
MGTTNNRDKIIINLEIIYYKYKIIKSPKLLTFLIKIIIIIIIPTCQTDKI